MTTYDKIHALIKAHYRKDERFFEAVTYQIAAGLKDEEKRKELRGLTQRLVPLPSQAEGLVWEVPRVELSDLTLETSLRVELCEIAREILCAEELGQRGLSPRSRLLFHGPTGCGKTSAAAGLGAALGRAVYCCSFTDVIQSYMGTTGAALGKVFSILGAGHVLLIDEFDAIGTARGPGGGSAEGESNRIVNTLLTLLDRNRGSLLICATNRLDVLDSAIVRRFDEKLLFDAPSAVDLTLFADRLRQKFGLDMGAWADSLGENYDSATKVVMKEARRLAMIEIAKASAA